MKTKSCRRLWLLAGFVLLWAVCSSRAQTSPRSRTSSETKSVVAAASLAQQEGLENLDRIALEARQIDEPAIRTTLQALIGDALWDFDKPTARSIFIDAFKNARAIEDKHRAAAVQTQVVRHVWSRDRSLAEEMMKQLSASKDQKNIDPPGDFGLASQFGMQSADATAQQKLDLASDLLDEDAAAAADLISKSLDREVTFAGINRLSDLRAVDPETADRVFTRAVGQLQSMPSTAGVLAAIAMADYISPTCAFCSQRSLEPQIFDKYYESALRVLRGSIGQTFAPPPVNRGLQDRLVQYFHETQALLAMSLSRFARPNDLGDLQTIYSEQLKMLDPQKQQRLQAMQEAQKSANRFDDLYRQVESSEDQSDRDNGFYNLAELILARNPSGDMLEKIDNLIRKIDSKVLHDKAWSHLKLIEVQKLTKENEFDQAYALALKLPDPSFRAKALREVAAGVTRKGSETLRGPMLLTEATESVKKADPSIDRSQFMFRLTSDLVGLKDYDRAFEALQSSSASIGDLKKESFEQPGAIKVPISYFDYSGTFGRLGSVDFEKTMFLAQGIKWKEFRLAAEIATCRSVLNRSR